VLHYIELTPKYSTKSGIFGIKVDLGMFISKDESYYEETSFETDYRVSPGILLTPYASRYFDLTIATSFDYIFGNGYSSSGFEFSIGFGCSDNLDIWAIRPKIGIYKNLESGKGFLWSPGLGVSFNIKYKKD